LERKKIYATCEARGNKIFTFTAVGTSVDLSGLTNPVAVVLTIGVNTGSTLSTL
jgi:hypothetical protein